MVQKDVMDLRADWRDDLNNAYHREQCKNLQRTYMACNAEEKKMVRTDRLNVLNRKKPLTLISNILMPKLMLTEKTF